FDCAECHKYHGGDAHLSFPESSLGTHYREVPASATSSNTPSIRLASFQAAPSATPAFTGASTCASAGCHGATSEKSAVWQTSFTTWASRDPHTEAFSVLWTFRGREMTQLLSQSAETLSDRQHLQTLEHRCVGCHATPAPDSSAN